MWTFPFNCLSAIFFLIAGVDLSVSMPEVSITGGTVWRNGKNQLIIILQELSFFFASYSAQMMANLFNLFVNLQGSATFAPSTFAATPCRLFRLQDYFSVQLIVFYFITSEVKLNKRTWYIVSNSFTCTAANVI